MNIRDAGEAKLMWNRACPLCFVKLPRASLLVHSDQLVCPSCHTAVELSRASRVLAATVGLLGAYFCAQFFLILSPRTAWLTAFVAAVLGYAFGSALFVYLLADLVVRPKPAAAPFPQIHQ